MALPLHLPTRRHSMAVSPSTSSTAAVPINPSLQKASLRRMPQAAVVPQQLPQRTLTLQSTQPVVSTSDTKRSLASIWREIQGVDDWSGLVDPLNSLLRQEVVRYGELVIACYKAFDVDPSSKRYLSCKYGRSRMLNEVGLSSAGYEITRYIYATPGISILSPPDARRGRWIGYVAVSSSAHRLGRRDILVAFRGTVTAAEWAANFMSSLTPAALDPLDPRPDVKVESGFLSLYTTADPTAARLGHGSCREQLLGELWRLIEHHKGEQMSITVAGHSMGSALALLLGYDLAELGLNRAAPVAVYSFGGPRVGNAGFKRRMEELGVKVLRVVNVRDPVTKLPGLFLNEGWRVRLPWSGEECYEHVGVELALDFFQLRDYPACVHDLDNYLGTLLRGQKCSRVVRGSREGLNAVAPPTERLVAKRRTRFEGWEYWMDAAFMVVGDWVKSLRLVEL